MSRASVYNRNYPGKRIDKGVMSTHDLQVMTNDYMNRAIFLDTLSSHKIALILCLHQCMQHATRVSPTTDIRQIKDTVNYFMSINEYAPESVLKLLCSYIEAVLFQSDSYHGFNNYRWSHEGSNQWHIDHPNDYSNPASREMPYTSQEYHRVYY